MNPFFYCSRILGLLPNRLAVVRVRLVCVWSGFAVRLTRTQYARMVSLYGGCCSGPD